MLHPIQIDTMHFRFKPRRNPGSQSQHRSVNRTAVIGVINTAFGAVEELSFDLRHKRCITCCAAMGGGENERTQARDDLAKEFTRAIRSIVQAAARPDTTKRATRSRARVRPVASAGAPPEVPQQPAAGTDVSSGDPKLDEIVDSVDKEAKSKKKDRKNWNARFSNGRILLNVKIADLSVRVLPRSLCV